ncbi:Exopolysaccharide regulatory protein Exor [Neofusicoccum parvum]|nr:Exopolysaccharide regulatory protein Exor [Neofusicoccum parvum]
MSNRPTYLQKAPRFTPGIGTLVALALGSYIIGIYSTANPNISADDPTQGTPWPPPLNDNLDDNLRQQITHQFHTRQLSQKDGTKECTDRHWTALNDAHRSTRVLETHRHVRADGTNDTTARLWVAEGAGGRRVYSFSRTVGAFNGPVLKEEVQKCALPPGSSTARGGGGWQCEPRRFFEAHARAVLGMRVYQKIGVGPPEGFVEDGVPEGRVEDVPTYTRGSVLSMEERFRKAWGKEMGVEGSEEMKADARAGGDRDAGGGRGG